MALSFSIVPFYGLNEEREHIAVPHQSRFARQLVNYGMIATGNHFDLDSLRGAPPPGEAIFAAYFL